jgi:hypothetical protein
MAEELFPADFNEQPFVLWCTAFLAEALADYPDRELVSFVTQGSATKSDAAGLTMVLGPHLVSLADGFGQVDANIAAMIRDGKYSISASLPYFPFFALPQGSTDKGDNGVDKRRTSDGGCPRKLTNPPAISLNSASRQDTWVREVKPTVGDVVHDMAVLGYASGVWQQPIFLLSDDFVAFFTQFHRHGSELWKSGFFWHLSGAPAWVVEYVLGFGLVPSSNIAQRFAHALLWILCSRIDADMEVVLNAETLPERVAYIAERRALGPLQARLYTALIYTDDPFIATVSTDVTLCVLRHLGRLMDESRAVLSNGVKMQIGMTIKWNGMFFNSHLCQVIVPPHKALRALATLSVIIRGGVVIWRVYQALVGLLEHIRFAIGRRRVSMYGMYTPFSRLGARVAGPEERVLISEETVERSSEWEHILTRRSGIFCAEAVLGSVKASEMSPADLDCVQRCFHCYTDAALAGALVASYGGWLHGHYFSYPIPAWLLGYPIPQQEFLAIIAGKLTFGPIIGSARAELTSDSKTSVDVITNDGAHSEQMQWLQLASEAPSIPQCFAHTRHGFGECNPLADFASRGRFAELRELSAQLGLSARELVVPPEFTVILERFRDRFGARHACDAPSARPVLHKNALALAQCSAAANKDGHMGRPVFPPLLPRLSPQLPPPPPIPRPVAAACPSFPRPVPYPHLSAPLAQPTPTASRFPHRPLTLAHLLPIGASRTSPSPPFPPRAPLPSPFGFNPCLRALQRAPSSSALRAASIRSLTPSPLLVRIPSFVPTLIHPHTRPIILSVPTPAPAHTSPMQKTAIRRPVERESHDSSPHAFDPSSGKLTHLFDAIGTYIDMSVPLGTLAKDRLAWTRWCKFCSLVTDAGISPWRLDAAAHSGADAVGHDRETRLLSAFLLWCNELIEPRAHAHTASHPTSAYNMVAAVRRVHRRRNITMVSSQQLATVLKGLLTEHIAEHGFESLLPQRKEPLDAGHVRDFLNTPSGMVLGRVVVDWNAPLFVSLGALFAVGISTGFRKAECATPNGRALDQRRLRRSNLLWRINGVSVADPTAAQLNSLTPGRDGAILIPPPSKADQFGDIWGVHPIHLEYDPSDRANAATWLQQVELQFPVHGARRAAVALFFTDAKLSAMHHSTVDIILVTS